MNENGVGGIPRVDPTDEKGLLALEETLAEAEEMVNSMRAWSDETRKECKSKVAQKMELTKNMAEFSSNLAKLKGRMCDSFIFCIDGIWIIGGSLLMMDNFPSLNDPAEIFHTGTHENRFLSRKILKKWTEIFFILTQVYRSFFGFREIAFVWTTTTPTTTH